MEQIDDDRTAKTEYTYDKQGNLIMVKNCLEADKAQYVQYVYDVQRNKVRQFTGMSSPLTLTVTEISAEEENSSSESDVFSYMGKSYEVKVGDRKKSDKIAETKYEYDGKNQLVAYTDPEGRRETRVQF